jgi:glycosyltransferase involved in cell wall biosynthesis
MEALRLLVDDRELAEQFGRNGIAFVDGNYGWDMIERKLCGLVEKVCEDEVEI